MKNIVLSAVAVLAMSSFAAAGGDIAPVEEPVVVVEPVVTDAGFYLGLAYGLGNIDGNVYWPDGNVDFMLSEYDIDYSTVMLQAGYKFNSYVAVEGRYWFGLDEDSTVTFYGQPENITTNIDTWGIYVKPMYPVTDAFDIYALLGYAGSTLDVDNGGTTYSQDLDGFSWGIGAAYSFNDNVSLFVDYVSMYDDDAETVDADSDLLTDNTISTWNFGVTYKF